MIEYCRGTIEDTQDIIDFADLIFSKNSVPHDFKSLVPKLYAEDSNAQDYHYLIKEDGRICAMVCVQPVEMRIGKIQLLTGGIGTVCVHPNRRGRGYMKDLMSMAIEDMDRLGFAYSTLGGQRQRYGYYGYETAGIAFGFSINRSNYKHRLESLNTDDISFEPIENWLEEAYELRARQTVAGVYKINEFKNVLHTWNSKVYAILKKGAFEGYVCLSGGNDSVFELDLCNEALTEYVLKALMEQKNIGNLYIKAAAYEKNRIAKLADICEEYRIGNDYNYRISSFEKTIEAFMRLKADFQGLCDGCFSIEIDNGESLELSVNEGKPAIRKLNSKDTADIKLTRAEATSFLFSAAGSIVYADKIKSLPECAGQWLPFPLYTSPLDAC